MDPEDAGSCAAPPEPYNGSNGPTAGRLGGWFKSTAASLEVHVKEIRANSKLIAADLQNAHQEAKSKIQKSFAGGVLAPGLEEVQLKVTFEEGSLGLNLDLADGQVIKVTPGGQAEQLGLRVQDRLLAVRGCSLPAVSEPNFQEAAKKQLSLAKQRPVNMTFLRIVPSEGKKNKEAQEESQQLRQAQAKIDELQVQVAARTNEAKAAREEAKALQAELQLAQNWTAQEERELQALRSELDDLRLRTKTNQAEAKRDEVKVAIQDEQALRDRAGAAAAEGDEEEEKRLQSALQKLQTSNKELELARLAREDLAGQLMRATADCMQHMQHEESSQKASARASLLEEELQREKTKLEQLRRQMSEASESLAKAEAEREELQASSNLLVDEMQSLRRILQQHESSESAARRLLEEQLAETKSSATKLREELQRRGAAPQAREGERLQTLRPQRCRAEAELEEKELWRRRLLELEEEARPAQR
ncbi:unnamed protein product [Symbiodinium sp. CCMP2592]|nr:unnamed protein product [Symbiodinium sp. CCMP2592]